MQQNLYNVVGRSCAQLTVQSIGLYKNGFKIHCYKKSLVIETQKKLWRLTAGLSLHKKETFRQLE